MDIEDLLFIVPMGLLTFGMLVAVFRAGFCLKPYPHFGRWHDREHHDKSFDQWLTCKTCGRRRLKWK